MAPVNEKINFIYIDTHFFLVTVRFAESSDSVDGMDGVDFILIPVVRSGDVSGSARCGINIILTNSFLTVGKFKLLEDIKLRYCHNSWFSLINFLILYLFHFEFDL